MKKDRNRVIGGPLDGECVSLIAFVGFGSGEYLFLTNSHRPDANRRLAEHHYVTVSGYVVYVGVTYDPSLNPEADARQAGLILGMVRG